MQNEERPIVDIVTLRRDLYIAMSLLLADKAADKLGDRFQWTGDFYEKEVRRLLLWVAVAGRNLIDSLDSSPNKTELVNQNCGEYWHNFASGKCVSLTLYQACNSIIHATEILLHNDSKSGTPSAKIVYCDRITVRGSPQKKRTRALINIVQFAESINSLLIT